MAMVTCPKCKKIVSNTSQKCPNCGAPLRTRGVLPSKPADKKLKTISSILMYTSGLLLFLDLFSIAKTYVGGILLGCGFVLQGLAQAKAEKAEGFEGKSKTKYIEAIGVIIIIAGIVYLYFDITQPWL